MDKKLKLIVGYHFSHDTRKDAIKMTMKKLSFYPEISVRY